MSKWRPEGWKESRESKHQKHIMRGYAGVDLLHYDRGFEAGAGAMIEAVCEEIEKVENPYSGKAPSHYDPLQTEEICRAEKRVYEEAKQDILEALES